jgi:transcriptional regulator with XRE-family HTH domain
LGSVHKEDAMPLRGLRHARQRSRLSIGQLAEQTGLRRELIVRLEQGKEEPQPYVLRRLAAALAATPAALAGPVARAALRAGAAPLRDP